MVFIEGLPSCEGANFILVVMDHLIKYAHLFPLHHPYTVKSVAKVFIDSVVKLHGIPQTIISDRYKIFTTFHSQLHACVRWLPSVVILDWWLVGKGNVATPQVLIQQAHVPQYTAWEDYYVLKQRYLAALWKKMSKLMRRWGWVMPSSGHHIIASRRKKNKANAASILQLPLQGTPRPLTRSKAKQLSRCCNLNIEAFITDAAQPSSSEGSDASGPAASPRSTHE
ncbi:uncharacterized protein [Aegilops tauschii subsp. strangulata]|uniref:uncharacterized protein n=1 Tax=Aegilops tauschii subsp. strangulata TaxID=200361 RepID=UPI00098AE323|nr:uncharacterized protein LOC109780814 [Aegilops tauschii subsp. strangulata]